MSRIDILETLAATARERVAEDKRTISLEEMKAAASSAAKERSGAFQQALSRSGLRFICEVKKASPSKGIISEDFPYLQIAKEYEAAGADAISCLTEPSRFLGSDAIFKEIRSAVKTPMIRKDFTVDEYQLYQAKAMGADCVLLICSLLNAKMLEQYLSICRELRMDALTETHDAQEIEMAVSAGAKMIGVNNRNLRDFSVDFSNAASLRDRIPADCLYVAESGVKTAEDIRILKKIGADAVLIGETLMRAANKTALLQELRDA